MTDKKMTGREILIAAMEQYDITYCDEFPPIEAELQFDEECEKNLRKLIRRLNNPFQRYFNTAGRRVAGIAAAILIFFGCSMTVSAVRKPVVEFLINVYEKLVEFFFDEESIANAPSTIETVYTLGYIPEGYELKEIKRRSGFIDYTWKNENGSQIFMSQRILAGTSTLDNENSNFTIIYRMGVKIAFIEKFEAKAFKWNSAEYEFYLTIPDDFSLEECMILIESLVSIDSTELEVIE